MTFEELKKLFKMDREFSAEWREQAKRDLLFYAGEQWDPEDLAYLKETNRPPIVYNRTATVINSVVGNEIQNRREAQFFAREQGDLVASEVLNSAGEWFRDVSDSEDSESEMFRDTCVCGMGWTETTLDYDENPDGDPQKYYRDPLSMFWDCNARRKNLTDRTRQWFVKDMPLDEAKRMFPGKTREQLHAGWTGLAKHDPHPHDQDQADEYDPDYATTPEYEELHDIVRIVHCQYKTKEKIIRVTNDLTGRTDDLTQEEYDQLNQRLIGSNGQAMIGRPAYRTVYREMFIGADILQESEIPVRGFTFECTTGYRNHIKGTFYGMVESMRTPQQMANKWLSQIMHIVSTSGRGIMAEITAAEDQKQFEDSWAQSDEVTWVNPGGIEKIKPKQETRVPPEFFRMVEFSVSSIRDVTGVNLEMLGLRGAIQANSLEHQRKESGLTILAPLFDALKLYRRRDGRIMLEYIQRYLSDGRLIRIAGGGTEKYARLALDADVKYDIIVDEAPSSPHMKERVWAFIAPMMTKMPPQAISEMLVYSPLPMSVVQRLQKVLASLTEPKPEQQQAVALEMEQKKADIDKTKATAYADRVGAAVEQTQANLDTAEFIRSVIQGENINGEEESSSGRAN